MSFREELGQMRSEYSEKLGQFTQEAREMMKAAMKQLETDIEDPKLTSAGTHADDYMLRANQIGLALFENQFFSLADELYWSMARLAQEYRDRTGNWRHLGAMHANRAIVRSVLGDLDDAVVFLLRAAQDDVKSYNIAQSDSYAITQLLHQHLVGPATKTITQLVRPVNPNVTDADVETLFSYMGNRRYALMAYVVQAAKHYNYNKELESEYSRLQVFSAIRSLSSLLEVRLKILSGHMEDELFKAMRRLYGKKLWWPTFDSTRISLSSNGNSPLSADDKLKNALAFQPADDVSRFWRGLMVVHVVRNYTIHYMESECELVKTHPLEAMAHILDVMTSAKSYI